ncbi:phosphoglycolate phosphatase [Sinimarinibacterium flocculans]|uniref:Phosphoglycolate phosphatase n=1 Tax=Sinimarinibacterium flocculans TaxID=985250 RepID=A0A318E8L5_9GAMM|nr:phosphoglycolate phosphatase [Sinimarinibacterium flocculans]PXV65630.1 phosphoglycolate phosphatase [Sinimarinibacterium flocculans]
MNPGSGAVVFDLDGTLVDSVADLRLCLNRALAELRLPPLGRAQVTAMVGDGVRTLMQRALEALGVPTQGDFGAAVIDRLLGRFMPLYAAAPSVHTRAYDGVPETLRQLVADGWSLAVCTNKPLAPSLTILHALGLDIFFDTVVGGDSTPARKPDPRPLRAALATLGIDAANAVMVGDGPHDAQAAGAAGTAFIGVRYGYGSDALAAMTLATPPVSRFDEIPERVRTLCAVPA